MKSLVDLCCVKISTAFYYDPTSKEEFDDVRKKFGCEKDLTREEEEEI